MGILTSLKLHISIHIKLQVSRHFSITAKVTLSEICATVVLLWDRTRQGSLYLDARDPVIGSPVAFSCTSFGRY